jgi:hypothetical protein
MILVLKLQYFNTSCFVDINECQDSKTCAKTNVVCENYPGGYNCKCANGYVGDATKTGCTQKGTLKQKLVHRALARFKTRKNNFLTLIS